jgi:hypothetical protein
MRPEDVYNPLAERRSRGSVYVGYMSDAYFKMGLSGENPISKPKVGTLAG